MEHKIISKDIDSLIFAEYNPRQLTKDQYKHLKDSIDRFGLVDPILVNKNKERQNIIIGGHQRVRIAKELKINSRAVSYILKNRSYVKEAPKDEVLEVFHEAVEEQKISLWQKIKGMLKFWQK